MATLETIRNKAGVLITVFIGLALVAFILTDLLTSGRSLFAGSSNEIGVVDGTSISYEEYQNSLAKLEEWTKMQYQQSSLDENTQNRLMDQNWEQLVRQAIMNNQYEELGVTVSDKEISTLFNYRTVHPAIQQMFTDPNTGAYNEQMAIESYKNRSSNPQANFYWNYLLEQIKLEKLNSKYTALITKGLYTTQNQLNDAINAKKTSYNFDFVLVSYSTMNDSTLKVSDSEINSYYNDHIENYKSEPSREIKYVTFDIKPSDEDNKATRKKVEKAKVRFENNDIDIEAFINRNSDNAPYVAKNLKYEDLKDNIVGFVKHSQVNDVYGPYFENDAYKLLKIVAIKELPDSVKARHILIRSENENAEAIADSILDLAKKGGDFAKLARENSSDQGSAINGGDLGWFEEGQMVKPFSDACFEGKKGDIVKVQSQYGFHIINIQDKGKPVTKYELATFSKKVLPSQKTRQDIYSKVTKFATDAENAEKFNASIEEQNLQPRTGYNIKINDKKIGNLASPRQLVKWSFDAEIGETSPIFELGNQFVIAILTKQQSSDYLPVESVKSQINSELLKNKKAEVLISKFNDAIKESQSLSSIAQKMKARVQSATNATFASGQINNVGFAPSMVGAVSQIEVGNISEPIKGNSGVFVLKLTGTDSNEVDVDTEKTAIAQQLNYKAYNAYDAIKKSTDIEDNRSNFY